MNLRKSLGASMLGVSALMASTVMVAAPSMAASCSTSHTTTSATGKCTGYSSTGTFRVKATFCSHLNGCITKRGPYAYLQGGTSKVNAPSGMHWSSDGIEYGPAGG
jgi:hypothetical protein